MSCLCGPVPQHHLPLPRSTGSPGLQSRVLGSEMGPLLGPAPFPAHRGPPAGPETSLLCRQHQPPPCPLPRPLTQLPLRPCCSHSGAYRLLEIRSRGAGGQGEGAIVTRCCVLGPQACDAWKKEAEEAGERASAAGAECELAREQRDAMEVQVKKLQEELGRLHSGPDPQALPAFSDLEALSLSTLYSLQKQLRAHLEQVDKVSPGWGSPRWGVQWPQPVWTLVGPHCSRDGHRPSESLCPAGPKCQPAGDCHSLGRLESRRGVVCTHPGTFELC